MATRARRAKTSDSYLALVKRFPVRRIRTEAERAEAVAIIREISLRGEPPLDEGELDYVDALGQFVADFERSNRLTRRKSTPLQLLKSLMEENGLRPSDIGRIIGSMSNATMILQGKRELSKQHIRKLSQRFNVSPGLFM